jgi:signal transduction histidine kinase
MDRGRPGAGSGSGSRSEPQPVGSGLSFRARLTAGLIAGAVVPLAGFGAVLVAAEVARAGGLDSTLAALVVFALAAAIIVAVLFAYILAGNLTSPLRAISRAVERVSAGDLSARVEVAGEDELARLVESHNRLAAALERRNRELGRILLAIGETSPKDGLDHLVALATASARSAFEMIDATIHVGDPQDVLVEEVIPGETRPVRAVLALPDERVGVLVGHLPATRSWDAADQDLLELFASEIAVAIRNAELFDQVQLQTRRLVELDAAKDDFLRGISHNLQTPLTSIRAYSEQLGSERPDRRLAIITEQAERLSRMVRQLLTVSRIDSGSLLPRLEVLALGPRVRRAWDALGAGGAAGTSFTLHDDASGWLAVADPDQLDQVLWALLDNAIRHGRGSSITVRIAVEEPVSRLRLTVADDGPGIPGPDRDRLFFRFERLAGSVGSDGSGLGLYVSRELCRAMGGDLVLEPTAPAGGATFAVIVPAEPPEPPGEA